MEFYEKNPKFRIALRVLGVMGAITSLILLTAYFFQNKLLYLPGFPNRYMIDNSPPYRSPSMRDMNFKDIEIKTADNVVIRG